MPALVAGIHVFIYVSPIKGVDGRDEPGHDIEIGRSSTRHMAIEVRDIEAEHGAMKRGAMKQRRFDNVWDAIEPTAAAAASMKARTRLMMAIREMVETWGGTQAAAAKRLGLTQPRMNDLLRGRIGKFSLDALLDIAARAGLTVRVDVRRPTA